MCPCLQILSFSTCREASRCLSSSPSHLRQLHLQRVPRSAFLPLLPPSSCLSYFLSPPSLAHTVSSSPSHDTEPHCRCPPLPRYMMTLERRDVASSSSTTPKKAYTLLNLPWTHVPLFLFLFFFFLNTASPSCLLTCTAPKCSEIVLHTKHCTDHCEFKCTQERTHIHIYMYIYRDSCPQRIIKYIQKYVHVLALYNSFIM